MPRWQISSGVQHSLERRTRNTAIAVHELRYWRAVRETERALHRGDAFWRQSLYARGELASQPGRWFPLGRERHACGHQQNRNWLCHENLTGIGMDLAFSGLKLVRWYDMVP
jgi:hypothetical protein